MMWEGRVDNEEIQKAEDGRKISLTVNHSALMRMTDYQYSQPWTWQWVRLSDSGEGDLVDNDLIWVEEGKEIQ